MRISILTLAFFLGLNIYSQERSNTKSLLREVSNKDVVQSVFPTAIRVDKVDKYWYKIVDATGKIVGFAMSSQRFCDTVIGYSDHTPVLIITDLKFIIRKIALLSNSESPGYVRKLERNGFFNLWNDKTVKKAKNIEINGYTGATLTARAVEKNVKFLLENGSKKMPRR